MMSAESNREINTLLRERGENEPGLRERGGQARPLHLKLCERFWSL
jgi:hypothetical protein